ncbi:MAG: hypothetical protein IPJ85_07885 [Flavobacteriales bacterium]|nr:hypothetical protein [Flavobacteriales bacterium]
MKRAIHLHAIGERVQFNDARERTNGKRSEASLSLGPGNKALVRISISARTKASRW